ncbi:MAG: hypothetical protein ACOY4K_16595 [Pseudomonadota bacterium]
MSNPRTPPRRDVIAEFRAAIAAAGNEGAAPRDMVLRVTHRDAALLKLSPAVGLDEISFADGEMRFLGVRVEIGAVTVSALGAPAA